MRIIHLALKDLSQILRDRRSLLFLLVMPIAFTIFMGFAYRSSSSTEDAKMVLGWANADPLGAVSQQLIASLGSHPSLHLVEVDLQQMQDEIEKVRKGELAAILSIPSGFSDAAFAGESPQIELYVDELSITGQTIFQIVRTPVTRVMGAVKIASLTTQGLAGQDLVPSGEPFTDELETAFSSAAKTWQRFADEGTQVLVVKGQPREENQPFGGNPYNQTSPGILTQFALFGLVSSANILVQERKTHTLQRLMTTSMSSAEIIGGHLLANFSLCFMQTLLLLVFGQLALGVDYLRQPAAILLISVLLSFWVAALGLAISVFASSDSQVVLFSLIAMFIFSALGGAWFPLDVAGAGFAAIGRLTPAAWVMTGYQNILLRGLDLPSVVLPAGILLAYTTAFLILAIWRFSRRVTG